MNILLINHYAGSPSLGMVFRPYYLSREWVKQGHFVTIVGGTFSHLREMQPVVEKDFTIEVIADGINYVWLKTPVYFGSGLKRFMSMLVFVFKLFRYGKRLIKLSSPDIVISSSTYTIDIYPAYRIAKKANAGLCFEIRDLWPLSPMLIGGFSKWHPVIMLMQAGENYACKKSDVIVSVLDNAKAYLMEHGMAAEKFHCIPNGFVMSEYVDRDDLYEKYDMFIGKLKRQNKLIVGYAGGIKPSNAMHVLVDAAKKLISNKDIAFVFVGKGDESDRLNKIIKDNNLDNVFILKPINKKAVLSFLEKTDILYIGGIKSELHKHGISPNKLIDYMLSAKPVIQSANVDENNIVTRLSFGITVPAEDSEAVKDAVLKLATMSEEERKVMGERGRKYALDNLNYENLAQRYLELFSNLRNKF